MSDDLAASWFKKTPGFSEPRRRRRRDVPYPSQESKEAKKPKEPAELYTEKDERHWRIQSIYGSQEEYKPIRRGGKRD